MDLSTQPSPRPAAGLQEQQGVAISAPLGRRLWLTQSARSGLGLERLGGLGSCREAFVPCGCGLMESCHAHGGLSCASGPAVPLCEKGRDLS